MKRKSDKAEVDEAKVVEAKRRKDAKADVTTDNLRNRLLKQFPQAVLLKDGSLPSQSQNQVELLFRTATVLKHGVQTVRETRDRTVTVGLAKVLLPKLNDRLTTKFLAVSNYVAKVQVQASLFANYVCISRYRSELELPKADSDFFTACLGRCRGVRGTTLQQEFTAFCEATQLTTLPPDAVTLQGLTQVFVYVAGSMKTAANQHIESSYLKRKQSLLKWAVQKRSRHLVPGLSLKVYRRRLHQLAEYTCAEPRTLQHLTTKLQQLGMAACTEIVVELLCNTSQDRPTTLVAQRAALIRLQDELLITDRRQYEAVINAAHVQHPGDQGKVARGEYISQQWRWNTPPKETAPLPFCRSRAAFVRYDSKALAEMFPDLKSRLQGPWGYRCFMNPFSKRADIPCLQSTESLCYSRSERGYFELLHKLNVSEGNVPWLVGASFLTDGVQMKLLLQTAVIDKPGAPGLLQLDKAGYQVSFHHVQLRDLLKQAEGVYRLQHVHATVADLQDVQVTAIDPGQVHVIDGCRAQGSAWRPDNVQYLMHTAEAVQFIGEQYREEILAKQAEKTEARRRRVNVAYGTATTALKIVRKRTCDLQLFTQYCLIWSAQQHVIWEEQLDDRRRMDRFLRFSAVQKTVAKMAELIVPMRDKGKVKRLVLFEDGSFQAKKGHASAPRKKIVRELCQRAVTVMVPAPYTSLTCPGCRKETQEGEDYRSRLCTTVIPACLLHPTTATFSYDRDAGARTNIGLRGVRVMCGQQAVTDVLPVAFAE